MSKSTLARFRVILCGPKFPGNIGSVARVAANFGVTEIVLVKPACRWRGQESRSLAVAGSLKLLDEAREADSLVDALEGCEQAVGFTRRAGRQRRVAHFHEQLDAFSGQSRVALVFGNEETGLTHEELRLCTRVAQLSTDSALPSMNLSHAVAVVLGRLHERFSEGAHEAKRGPGARPPRATLDEMEGLLGQWRELMLSVGLTQAGNPDRMIGRIREILNRAEPLPQDVKLFRAFLSKTQRALRSQPRNARDVKQAQ